MSFLGLVAYYKLFIKVFLKIVVPITSIAKKNTPIVWNENIKLALTN